MRKAELKSNTAVSTGMTSRFDVYLRQNASRYFPYFQGGIDIELLSKRKRPASTLYRYYVRSGGEQRHLLIKVPSNRETPHINSNLQEKAQARNQVDWPRLVPETAPEIKYLLEYSALKAIHNYFGQLNDARFGTVRVLDYFADEQALIMEEVRQPNLRRLLMKANRLQSAWSSSADLGRAFSNAGAWLAAYHKMPKQDNVSPRHTQRTEFEELGRQFSTFLSVQIGRVPFFQRLTDILLTYTSQILPESLPLGIGHGDYAMRNILIGADYQVTVLDTLAKWQTAIYEDIAYFLVGLKFNRAQVYSQGFVFDKKQINQYEQAFLTGYFEQQNIPLQIIRLYEVQAVLDKWLSAVSLFDRQHNGKKPVPGIIKLTIASRFYERVINNLLQDIVNQND